MTGNTLVFIVTVVVMFFVGWRLLYLDLKDKE